jgi:Dynein heavy chain, N-terminal region 2
VSDAVLLHILSIGTDLSSLQRHLPALFEGIHSFELVDIPVETLTSQLMSSNKALAHKKIAANSKQPSSQTTVQQTNATTLSMAMNVITKQTVGAMAIISANGERLSLVIQFSAQGAVENWLARLVSK